MSEFIKVGDLRIRQSDIVGYERGKLYVMGSDGKYSQLRDVTQISIWTKFYSETIKINFETEKETRRDFLLSEGELWWNVYAGIAKEQGADIAQDSETLFEICHI